MRVGDRTIDAVVRAHGEGRGGVLRRARSSSEKDAVVAGQDPARDPAAARLPDRRRPRLPHARSAVVDALGRRVAAHQPGDVARLGARGHALRARRAVDRPAPARQRAADRDPQAAARPGQHRARRRARRRHDSRRRRGRRPRPRRRRAGRPRDLRRAARRAARGAALAHREVPARRAGDSRAADAPAAGRAAAARARRARAQPQEHRRRDPARPADVRHRRQRIGQVHARARRDLRGDQARQGRLGPARRRAPQARGRGVHQRRRARRSAADRPHAAVESR